MNKSTKPYKLDDKMLLTLLLQQNKMSRKKWEQQVITKFNLNEMREIQRVKVTHSKVLPGTDQPMFSEDIIYDTGRYLVRTTKYQRIKDIESKPHSLLKPKVIVKKKRTFERPSK